MQNASADNICIKIHSVVIMRLADTVNIQHTIL
jgi:hypothetical protein